MGNFRFLPILFQDCLPFRSADLTASAALQNICGNILQLHALRLAYAANSTLAKFRWKIRERRCHDPWKIKTVCIQILAYGACRFDVEFGGNHALPYGIYLAEGCSWKLGLIHGILGADFGPNGIPFWFFKNSTKKYCPALSPPGQNLYLCFSGLEKLSDYYFHDCTWHHDASLTNSTALSRRYLCNHRGRTLLFKFSFLWADLAGKNQKEAVPLSWRWINWDFWKMLPFVRKAFYLKCVDLCNIISFYNFTAKPQRAQRKDTFLFPLRGRQKKNIQSLRDIFGF